MNEMIAAAKSGRGRANAYARMKETWTAVVEMHARSAVRERFDVASLHCVWHEPNARRDPDNIHAAIKFVNDGLVAAGVLPGDGRKHVAAVLHDVITDAKRPGVLVEIIGTPVLKVA